METGHPSTRAVNSGSGNRACQSCSGLYCLPRLIHSEQFLSKWMYVCIARIHKTPLTHSQQNADNRQTGGFQIPSKLVWPNSWIVQIVRQWIPSCRTSRSEGTATKGAADVNYLSFRLRFVCVFFCVIFLIGASVIVVGFVLFWLSAPVQSVAWKDSSPKWRLVCWVGR